MITWHWTEIKKHITLDNIFCVRMNDNLMKLYHSIIIFTCKILVPNGGRNLGYKPCVNLDWIYFIKYVLCLSSWDDPYALFTQILQVSSFELRQSCDCPVTMQISWGTLMGNETKLKQNKTRTMWVNFAKQRKIRPSVVRRGRNYSIIK